MTTPLIRLNEFESGENSPRRILEERVYATAYVWHNYGNTTIGARSDIENVPIDRLKDFYHRWYRPDNTTRFLVIGPQAALPSGNDKTSILVSVNNKPGALASMLQPIARHGISMTRIESRPSRQAMWEYVFYIDVDGHRDDDEVAAALAALEQETFAVKVLGSYPKAVI